MKTTVNKSEFSESEIENRKSIESKIEERIRNSEFDKDAFDDPVGKTLDEDEIDYLNKKLSSKIKTFIANMMARFHFERMIRKGKIVIDKVYGIRNYIEASKSGVIILSNHIHQFDNYVVLKAIEKEMPRKRLWRIIKEGNYTCEMPPFTFFFRNCNTLPLSSSKKCMIKFMKSVETLLKRKETILIYPEQSLWLNYKKPKPFKRGAFDIASRNNVPVVPIYLEIKDSNVKDEINPGYYVQRYTVHILKPVYPNENLNKKDNANHMMDESFKEMKEKYEAIYGENLAY